MKGYIDCDSKKDIEYYWFDIDANTDFEKIIELAPDTCLLETMQAIIDVFKEKKDE